MTYLISYDISHNRLRTRISNKLLEYGMERIQYSVFMGYVKSKHLKELKTALQSLMAQSLPDDSVIILPIELKSIKKITTLGKDDWDWMEISGQRKVLII